MLPFPELALGTNEIDRVVLDVHEITRSSKLKKEKTVNNFCYFSSYECYMGHFLRNTLCCHAIFFKENVLKQRNVSRSVPEVQIICVTNLTTRTLSQLEIIIFRHNDLNKTNVMNVSGIV